MAGALHWQQVSCCVFHSMSQKWSLSQSANKSSGTCSICLATRQIHFCDGTILHKRGPRQRSDGLTLVRPIAERQVFMLGRDGHMPSGRIIRHWVRPRGRCCSGTRRFSQRGKICHHWKRIPLCAHRGRNLRPIEHVGTPTLCQSGEKDLLGVRRWQRRSFSVPEFRCWCSATTLYCYTTPCQPLTARTDDLYPFVYYLIFKTPSGTYLPRVKK